MFLLATIFCCNQSLRAQSKIVDSLKNWVKTNPTIDSQYLLTLHRLSYQLNEKDIQQSFKYYEKVSYLSDSLNYVFGKSLAQINLGLLLTNSGNFDASNNAYFKALDYAEICKSDRLKAVCMNNIADNFQTIKDYDKCREYTNRAIVINTKLKAWRGVAINYELLHQCDLKEKLYKKAKDKLVTGMPFALISNENYILSIYYLGFGKLKAVDNQTDSALYYFKKAMAQAKAQNDLRNEYQVYIAETEYLKNIPTEKKIILLDSAYSIARQTSYLTGIANSAELLSTIYDNLNNKDSSWAYYHIYRTANDSLFSENNKRNLIIKESDWMIKRKEIENQHLQQLSLLQERELIFKNALLWAFIVLLFLVMAIAFFIYKSNQSEKKRTESLFRQKIAETKMQSLRAQMNPHFIFNSLNSIENFIMRNEKRAASDYLNKFAELVRIILDSSRSELVPFVKDLEGIRLYVELEQLRFNHKFSFETFIDDELLNNDYKVPALLIQPYIENAILHGLSLRETANLHLFLSATLENEYIIYVIEDNGIGREESKKTKRQNRYSHESIGIQLTQERINIFNLQQNAEGNVEIIDLHNEKNEGCGTKIILKIKAL